MKSIIITGANSGIGFECAMQMAKLAPDDQIILACRNVQAGNEAVQKIKQKTNHKNLICLPLNLASLQSVRDFKTAFLKLPGPAITALVNNAGLQNISVAETGGKLIGIMGGSGSGKSTLLAVLNGSEKPSSGRVLINGINIHERPHDVEGVIGFIPQDDLLMEDLTVYENLYYSARLCFGHYSDEEISDTVNRVLANLGLSEIKGLKVGSPLQKTISGGQRKRLNIGLELLREPTILFVDEPTSGLSSRDSENIMDLLKELTLRGKMIFVVIQRRYI